MSEEKDTRKTDDGTRTSPCSGSVFEGCDVTDLETYQTLGIWLTLQEALDAFSRCSEPMDFGQDRDYEDYCCVEIRERTLGWPTNEQGRCVAKLEWVRNYDETKDEYIWEMKPNDRAELPGE